MVILANRIKSLEFYTGCILRIKKTWKDLRRMRSQKLRSDFQKAKADLQRPLLWCSNKENLETCPLHGNVLIGSWCFSNLLYPSTFLYVLLVFESLILKLQLKILIYLLKKIIVIYSGTTCNIVLYFPSLLQLCYYHTFMI